MTTERGRITTTYATTRAAIGRRVNVVSMTTERGRITFAGNPWPKGHALEEVEWTGELDRDGRFRFHLHLVSVPYAAEDDRDDPDPPPDDWLSRDVWKNYGHCTLSSTYWRGQEGAGNGFVAARPGEPPLDLHALAGTTYELDPLDALPDRDHRAFALYLLGHDSVGGHRITFVERTGPLAYRIEWRAKVALSYAGDTLHGHDATIAIPSVQLASIRIPDGMPEADARARIATLVVGAGALPLST